MGVFGKIERKSDTDKPLQGTQVAKVPPRAPKTSSLGAVPRIEDETVHPTQMRGAKFDGRRLPRTGRLYQMNIRANEEIVKQFDADATKLKLTRGAFFEKCYHAYTAGLGDRSVAFLLQAMTTLEQMARFESKERGKAVTPEALLKNILAHRMDRVGMLRGR
jgi:hypothetical protein